MATNSTYSQILISDEEADAAGLEKVWENEFFVICDVHAHRGGAVTRWSG